MYACMYVSIHTSILTHIGEASEMTVSPGGHGAPCHSDCFRHLRSKVAWLDQAKPYEKIGEQIHGFPYLEVDNINGV